jgi:hypothetical protein
MPEGGKVEPSMARFRDARKLHRFCETITGRAEGAGLVRMDPQCQRLAAGISRDAGAAEWRGCQLPGVQG